MSQKEESLSPPFSGGRLPGVGLRGHCRHDFLLGHWTRSRGYGSWQTPKRRNPRFLAKSRVRSEPPYPFLLPPLSFGELGRRDSYALPPPVRLVGITLLCVQPPFLLGAAPTSPEWFPSPGSVSAASMLAVFVSSFTWGGARESACFQRFGPVYCNQTLSLRPTLFSPSRRTRNTKNRSFFGGSLGARIEADFLLGGCSGSPFRVLIPYQREEERMQITT